jgi:hypothetical protein
MTGEEVVPPLAVRLSIELVSGPHPVRRWSISLTNHFLGDFIEGAGDIEQDLALLGTDRGRMVPAPLGEPIMCILGAIRLPGDTRGSDCTEMMLKQLDQELAPIILILFESQLELRLVADGLTEKAYMGPTRGRTLNDAAVQDVTMSMKMDILEEGLKDLSAFEVEDLQTGCGLILAVGGTSGEEFDPDDIEVAVAKPSL